jgi:hypothetical protein
MKKESSVEVQPEHQFSQQPQKEITLGKVICQLPARKL